MKVENMCQGQFGDFTTGNSSFLYKKRWSLGLRGVSVCYCKYSAAEVLSFSSVISLKYSRFVCDSVIFPI